MRLTCGTLPLSLLADSPSRSALCPSARAGISEDQELAIGAADAAKVDSELPILRDSVITQYVSATRPLDGTSNEPSRPRLALCGREFL